MKPEEVQKLSDNVLRCSVHNLIYPTDIAEYDEGGFIRCSGMNGEEAFAPLSAIEDYPQDLNAMHEAVVSLSELDRARFWLNVARVILVGYVDRRVAQCHFEEIAEATARQRAEAFVLTVSNGGWE